MIERMIILSSDGAPLDVFVLFSDTELSEVASATLDARSESPRRWSRSNN
jgi:hypothetical protein